MTQVYATIRASLQYLFVFAVVIVLNGCVTDRYLSWGTPVNTGVVTKDPNSIPDIAWQTQGQRRELEEQNAQFQQTAPTPEIPARKVSVAILLPLSGKNADLGQSMLKSAQMALFDVGSANFELVPQDTGSTKEGAAAAARIAVANHVDMILGPVFADDVREVKQIAEQADTPVIAFSTDWTLADGDTYIMGFLPFAQVARVAQYANSHGFNRFAVYAPETAYCDVAINTLQRTGADVVKMARYSPQQPDLSALVAEFAARTKVSETPDGPVFDFNALMLPLGGEGLRSLVSVLDANGIKSENIKFIGTGLWDDASLISNAALFGGWFAAPDPALRRDFEKRYHENYGAAPMRLSSLAYDATALAAVLARSTDGTSSPYSRDRLTNPRGFAGIDGIFRFRSDGMAERGLAVLEIQSGMAKVIDPAPTAFFAPGS